MVRHNLSAQYSNVFLIITEFSENYYAKNKIFDVCTGICFGKDVDDKEYAGSAGDSRLNILLTESEQNCMMT